MEDLLQVFANTADGAFAVDEDQRIIYWSQAAEDILGYTSDEVMGQPCYQILRGRDDKGKVLCHHCCRIATVVLTGKTIPNYNLAIRTKAGEMRWINVSILTTSPAENNSSPIIVHLFRDATKIKQNEQFIHQMFDSEKNLRRITAPAASAVPVRATADPLTEREREVLSLLAQGSKTSEIAQTLSISTATVRNHVQRILYKLHVHSRVEAVAYAFEHGLISGD